MYTLTKEIRFEAAHRLPAHDGQCARLHGHSFKARIILQGERLKQSGPKEGMLLDFKTVSEAVKPILEEKLDHHYLNETLPINNPTSENIAKWLYGELKGKLPLLHAIEVDETCTCSCRYEKTPDSGIE